MGINPSTPYSHPITEALARKPLSDVRNRRPSLGGAEPAGGRAGPEGRQHLTPGACPPSHLLLHLLPHPSVSVSSGAACLWFLFGSTVVHIRIRERLIHGPALCKNIKIDNSLSCLIKKMGRKHRNKTRGDKGKIIKHRGSLKKLEITFYHCAHVYLCYSS